MPPLFGERGCEVVLTYCPFIVVRTGLVYEAGDATLLVEEDKEGCGRDLWGPPMLIVETGGKDSDPPFSTVVCIFMLGTRRKSIQK